jgi:hypothetical protein
LREIALEDNPPTLRVPKGKIRVETRGIRLHAYVRPGHTRSEQWFPDGELTTFSVHDGISCARHPTENVNPLFLRRRRGRQTGLRADRAGS